MSAAGTPPSARIAVDVGAIERELAAMWKAPDGDDAAAPTRACMSNLVIFCASEREAQDVPGEIAWIVQRHPSRVLLLIGETAPGARSLEASVSAVCHLASGGRQICSEHVTVNAGDEALRGLPSAARSLLIGDLPSALWWATAAPPPEGGELFGELAAMTDHVIYDSRAWERPARGLRETADWASASDAAVSDLAWRRLEPLRRMIGETLDPALMPGALEGIEALWIDHAPGDVVHPWLLLGWLATSLGWTAAGGRRADPDALTLDFRGPHGPLRVTLRPSARGGMGRVGRLSLRWRGAQGPGGARFEAPGDGRLLAAIEGGALQERVVPERAADRAALVASALPERRVDPLFRRALGAARTLLAGVDA